MARGAMCSKRLRLPSHSGARGVSACAMGWRSAGSSSLLLASNAFTTSGVSGSLHAVTHVPV